MMRHYEVAEKIRMGHFSRSKEEEIRKVIVYINHLRIVGNDFLFSKFEEFIDLKFLKKLEDMGLITQRYNPENQKYYSMLGSNAKYIIDTFFAKVKYNNFEPIMDNQLLEKVLQATTYIAKNDLCIIDFGYDTFTLKNEIVIASKALESQIQDAGFTGIYYCDLEPIAVEKMYAPERKRTKKFKPTI